MQTKLMLVSEYRDTFFTAKSRPAINTLKKWIREGDLPGKRIGNLYYVKVENSSPVPDNFDHSDLYSRAGLQ